MSPNELDRHLGAQLTRRRVVSTGAKLAYAAPLVAATFKLTARGALAVPQCRCDPEDEFGFKVTSDPSTPLCDDGPGCCSCGCTTGGPYRYDRDTNSCVPDGGTGIPGCDPDCVCCTETVSLP